VVELGGRARTSRSSPPARALLADRGHSRLFLEHRRRARGLCIIDSLVFTNKCGWDFRTFFSLISGEARILVPLAGTGEKIAL
jgi:hypothetical protein